MTMQRTLAGLPWAPWREFGRIQAEMDRLSHSINDSYDPGFPPVNVWADEDGASVTAEIPGVDADALEITVLGDRLTLGGRREAAALADGARRLHQERGHGRFSRSFRLPYEIDTSGVDAHFRDGVLELRLPRAAADRPRKIQISAA